MSSDEKDPADTPDDAELAVTHGDAETADTEFTDIPEGVDDGDLSAAAPETDGPSTGEETVEEAADTAAGVTDGEGVDADATDSATTDSDEADPDAAGTDEKVDGEAAGDESSDDKAAGKAKKQRGPHSDRNSGTIVVLARALSSVALIAAIVCTGYFGYTAVRDYFWTGPTQELRDDSAEVAEKAVLYTLTVDPSKMDEWKSRVEKVLTGSALSDVMTLVKGDLGKSIDERASSGAALTVREVASAPISVDESNDTAKVLVFVQGIPMENGKAVENETQPLTFMVTVVGSGDDRKASEVIATTDYAADSSSTSSSSAPTSAAPTSAAPATTTTEGEK